MKSKRLIALLASAALLLSGCSSLSKKKELTYTDTLFVYRFWILQKKASLTAAKNCARNTT